MRFYILLFFVAFTVVSCSKKTQQASAATDTAVQIVAAKSDFLPKEKSLLWKISGKDLSTPSYLYGTIHMINKDDFFLTSPTKSTFKEVNRVAFEINMEDLSDMSVIFSMMGKIMMAEGTTLKDLLSEEEYDFVDEKFTAMGLPLSLLGRMKPMFLSTFAAGGEGGGDMMNGSMVSYEMEFMNMAKEQGKEMAGLETIEFQLSMFDSIPYKDQAEMLVESLKSTDSGSDQLEQMINLYKSQDIQGMQSMFEEEGGGLEGYEDILLEGRNRNWIPIIEKMMDEKPTFFAVGAGHLGGETGVIALLRKEGYAVEAIR